MPSKFIYGSLTELKPKKMHNKNGLLYLFLLSLFFFSSPTMAQVRANVFNDQAIVYKEPHFDADVVTSLKAGKKCILSKKLYNQAFYKIKWSKNKIGYIADTDVDFKNHWRHQSSQKNSLDENLNKNQKSKNQELGQALDTEAEQEGAADPFRNAEEFEGGADQSQSNYEWKRFLGFESSWVAFKEKTMGKELREDHNYFGLRWRGPEVVSWLSYVDTGFKYLGKAPQYYEKYLGYPASGYSFLAHFAMATSSSMGKKTQFFYGFGPFLRYSQWNVSQLVNSVEKSYQLTDVKMGAMVLFGLAYFFDPISIRGDFQFHWESTTYSSFALGLEWPY